METSSRRNKKAYSNLKRIPKLFLCFVPITNLACAVWMGYVLDVSPPASPIEDFRDYWSLTGKVVCLLVPEGSMGKAELESIRGWSAKAKSIGVTFRTTIADSSGDIDQVVAYSPEGFEEKQCDNVLAALKSGGQFDLLTTAAAFEDVESNLVFSGFIVDKHETSSNFAKVSASKPTWKEGDYQELPKTSNNLAEQTKLWEKMAVDYDGDDDLENEDDLLKLSDVSKAKSDCGTGAGKRRRACKNCSCGLREELNAEAAGIPYSGEQGPPKKSACGNCSKGDAFRCEGCPYRGLPAFDSNDTPNIKVTDGTVTLDLDDEIDF